MSTPLLITAVHFGLSASSKGKSRSLVCFCLWWHMVKENMQRTGVTEENVRIGRDGGK